MGAHITAVCKTCDKHYDFMRRSCGEYSFNGRSMGQMWDFLSHHDGHDIVFYGENSKPLEYDPEEASDWESYY